MAERKAFLLRIAPEVLAAMQRWAADDLRSLNAQVEFVLRRTLATEGRLRATAGGRASARGPAAPDDAGPS